MKATISELWKTGRDIITFNDSDTERPQTIADLKKCENVIVGDKMEGTKMYEALIGEVLVYVTPITVWHPMGGKMHIIEVIF